MRPVSSRSTPARLGWRLRPLAAALGLLPLLAGAGATAAATAHVVTTCDDAPVLPVCGSDDGTLRQALWCAADSDEIDLTQLQCGKITLAAPLIVGTITAFVDGPPGHPLMLDAGGNGRAIVHNGRPEDTLFISGLTITNGRYDNPYTSGGGGACIYSSGSVYLFDSEVSNCYLSSSTAVAKGGAIFAKGIASLSFSTVSNSKAVGLMSQKYSVAMGGGVYADTADLFESTVTGNSVISLGNSPNDAGGVRAREVTSKYSTVDHNQARTAGGISANGSLFMLNSTVSGNQALYIGGVLAFGAQDVAVYNSTITLNEAVVADGVGGLSANSLRLEGSILFGNTAAGQPADFAATGSFTGSHDLIGASYSPVPPDTWSEDPKLGPLRNNGGATWTHAPSPGSVARDHGNNAYEAGFDQRGLPRVGGKQPDIGAVEFDSIFSDGFGPTL